VALQSIVSLNVTMPTGGRGGKDHRASSATDYGSLERDVDHGQTGGDVASACSVSSHRRVAVAGSLAEG
jgi:hypothetical protein